MQASLVEPAYEIKKPWNIHPCLCKIIATKAVLGLILKDSMKNIKYVSRFFDMKSQGQALYS